MSPSVDTKDHIKQFLDAIGRVRSWPAKYTNQLYVIAYLAQKIPSGRVFSEKQITDLLSMRHTFGDAAMLRKSLFEQRYIDRDMYGTLYTKK